VAPWPESLGRDAEDLGVIHQAVHSIRPRNVGPAKTDGLQLLKRLKEIQPESSRMLLTDCIDLTLAIQAINEVALFLYL
jgi:hypothetical protein